METTVHGQAQANTNANELSAPGAADLLTLVELSRVRLTPQLSADKLKRSALGQFFTPADVASLMADMIKDRKDTQTLRILDPGSGNGILIAAALAKIVESANKPKEIIATAWELDDEVIPNLDRTLNRCRTVCNAHGISFISDRRRGDFIKDATTVLNASLFGHDPARFDLAIINPPYRKLNSDSAERLQLRNIGIETSNLYSAFLWLATRLLCNRGQLVAITPRSFMNGAYFKPFRRALLREMQFDRVHVFETRDTAFAGDDVLQENVIISALKSQTTAPILVTTSESPKDEGYTEIELRLDQFVVPADPEQVMHIVPGENEAEIAERMRALPTILHDMGLDISTGRIVDFRARDRLHKVSSAADAPMVLPAHFRDGYIHWPSGALRKPEAYRPRGEQDPDLMPAGWYVVVKRFSAKEERRRVVAAVFDPNRVTKSQIGFDNKLNVIHRDGRGLAPDLAKGIALFLNSTIVDAYFRQFSGHTQVNATDLRAMRLPAQASLETMGKHLNGKMPVQDEIDRIVREEVPSVAKGRDPVAAKAKIQDAVAILRSLNAPREQWNDRSALTLLALLDLTPAKPWTQAGNPPRGVTECIDWMAANYGKKYAPNTRETIRRFTLHQFIQMSLVLLNADEPSRPPNSPKNVYQLDPDALRLLQTFRTDGWEKNLEDYLSSVEGKNRLRESSRQIAQIPVSLPDGQLIQLSGGGQNVLIKEILEQFAPRFTPGGHVIYVGDAGEKHLLNDTAYLARLGVTVDRHGKMPDVIIHFRGNNWLVLIEAVTSHGPVNLLRHNQLKDLFAASTAGLVFVTAFRDRHTMREFLPEIAWETEVWSADAPSHLIHFNGSRFLGPYPK